MSRDEWMFWLTIASSACWLVCFGWMHIISVKQNALLAELQQQARRIEHLSKDEHDLLQEVHPQIGQIHAKVKEVSEKVDASP